MPQACPSLLFSLFTIQHISPKYTVHDEKETSTHTHFMLPAHGHPRERNVAIRMLQPHEGQDKAIGGAHAQDNLGTERTL